MGKESISEQPAESRMNQNYYTKLFSLEKIDTEDVKVEKVADIVLPTGNIAACDPLAFTDLEAFNLKVEPGTYPVTLSYYQGDVAAAKIDFSTKDIVTWVMAVTPADVPAFEKGAMVGYGVDSARGCFVDIATAEAIKKDFSVTDQIDTDDTFMDLKIDRTTGANIVAFRSGWGDGVYTSWWGMDGEGKPACLVTNFELVPA